MSTVADSRGVNVLELINQGLAAEVTQRYSCVEEMPIPPFDSSGNLPPGVHMATWTETITTYGTSPWRLQLLAGIKAAFDDLKAAGCQRAYIDGSFVTAKQDPGDFDACWEAAGVVASMLDPVLLTFDSGRATQRSKYGGELFPAERAASPQGTRFIDFFQQDKYTGLAKGIIGIDLGGLP